VLGVELLFGRIGASSNLRLVTTHFDRACTDKHPPNLFCFFLVLALMTAPCISPVRYLLKMVSKGGEKVLRDFVVTASL